MEIRSCPECGKIFVDTGAEVCPKCLQEEERQFETVRKFLQENPGVSIDYVCEKTDVEKERIMKFLRQGRLIQSRLTGVELRCEVCGAVIFTGRVCDNCVRKLQNVADELSPEPKVTQPGRIHIFNHIKDSKK
ncbi:MAG: zinc ribbon domain-containing protein [Ignavibacteriales bacterium]